MRDTDKSLWAVIQAAKTMAAMTVKLAKRCDDWLNWDQRSSRRYRSDHLQLYEWKKFPCHRLHVMPSCPQPATREPCSHVCNAQFMTNRQSKCISFLKGRMLMVKLLPSNYLHANWMRCFNILSRFGGACNSFDKSRQLLSYHIIVYDVMNECELVRAAWLRSIQPRNINVTFEKVIDVGRRENDEHWILCRSVSSRHHATPAASVLMPIWEGCGTRSNDRHVNDWTASISGSTESDIAHSISYVYIVMMSSIYL